MWLPILEQVKYDTQEFQKILNAINKARLELPTMKGKPKYDTLLIAIEHWENDLQTIKQTLVPYMKELTKMLETDHHINNIERYESGDIEEFKFNI